MSEEKDIEEFIDQVDEELDEEEKKMKGKVKVQPWQLIVGFIGLIIVIIILSQAYQEFMYD